MRTPLIRLGCLLSLLIGSAASAVTMAWTPIGNPGNPADTTVMSDGTTGYGSVASVYQISAHEVTNAQYTEFLNAVAAEDPNGLYFTNMSDPRTCCFGGITRSGSPGGYSYSTILGRENLPVNYVSYFDAIRFVNWLNNGQPMGAQDSTTTEDGAYTLTGLNQVGPRNNGATIVLPTENEWYKAAYYDPASSDYFAYPTSSNAQVACTAPGSTANTANCYRGNPSDGPSSVGGYTSSASPYGTFDQGANVWEWVESDPTGVEVEASFRVMRGGSFAYPAITTGAEGSRTRYPDDEFNVDLGFRVAMIPEPGTGLLVIAGLLGLAGWRRARA